MEDRNTDATTALYAALVKAQGMAHNAQKNSAAVIEGREYRYATLDVVRDLARPILSDCGLAFVGQAEADGIRWWLVHEAGGSSEWVQPWPVLATPLTPHQLGTLITYYTRYQLCLLLGIAAEDDIDGEAAQAAVAAQSGAEAVKAKIAKTAPQDDAQDDDAVEAAKKRAWNAMRSAGINPKTDKIKIDQAIGAAGILDGQGRPMWFSKMGVIQLDRLTEYLQSLVSDEPPMPPEEEDPFAHMR